MAEAPAEIRDLLRRRAQARADSDFALADRLRDQIEVAGWVIRDTPQGASLESRLDTADIYPTYASVPGLFDRPNQCEFSLCIAHYRWPQDVRRLLSALGPDADVAAVVVDIEGSGVVPRNILPATSFGWANRARAVRVAEELGHAQAWNVAARQAVGRILCFVEPSLEFGISVLVTLARALEDPDVGLVGPFGLATADSMHFEPSVGPDVAALEYLLAMRRADLPRVGEFDPRFRFYRNLDIDFSYQVRSAGLEVRRVDCGSVTEHRHRLWDSTPEAERERLSRKNFNRFLDRWVRS